MNFRTEHFNVVYLPDLEPVAFRAADRAEWAYEILARDFVDPPDGSITLLLTDNLDLPNGLASPIPRNRIILYAVPPALEPSLAYHDDWLQMLVLHELVHIFHLDNAGGIWEPLRSLLGRDPALFPQVFTPGWVVEGLATYFESEITSLGRVHGSTFPMMARAAVLEDQFFSLDQASLDPVSWPAATTRYIYGSLFIDYLAGQAGADRVGDWIDQVGTQIIPYRPGTAARRTMGIDLSDAWTAWQDSLRNVAEAELARIRRRGITEPEILTVEGRAASHPRYSPDGRTIGFAASTGRLGAGHRFIDGDGRLVTRFDRSGLSAPVWMPGGRGILFAQHDFDSRYIYSADLYIQDLGGERRRVTEDQHVWDPDVHPSGTHAVAVQAAGGTNVLVRVDIETGEVSRLTEPDLDVYWSGPRFSPDGLWLAASRWAPGGRFDIVLLNPTTGQVLREVSTEPSIEIQPTWSPDGRYLLFVSDLDGIPNVYARDRETDRLWQVTNVATGAFHPDVSPDGRTLLVSVYRADGYHIARLPFDPAQWLEPPNPTVIPASPIALAPAGRTQPRPYSALPTLLPTYWSPHFMIGDAGLGSALGFSIAGEDVTERHTWAADLNGFLDQRRFDGQVAYRYYGFGNPTLDLAADQLWSTEIQPAAGEEGETILRREREASVALGWLRRRWRSATSLQTSLDVNDTELVERTSDETVRDWPTDLGASLGLGYSSVRAFGLSLGAQDGFSSSLRVQGRQYLGSDSVATAEPLYWRVTSRSRAYRAFDWFGFAPPVLAFRLDGALEATSTAAGFNLGGTPGASSGFVLDPGLFGTSATYPVRGFRSGAQRGNRVVSATAEYRFPIRLVERGLGLFPVGLDRLWGDVFLDAGAAWCEGACDNTFGNTPTSPDPLISAGIEGILELRVGFVANLPLRFGVGFPLRGGTEPQGYLRLASSF